MSCKANHDLMDAYVDGELDLVRSLEFEQHLTECPECSRVLEQRRTLVSAIRSAPLTYEAPANLIRATHAALRHEKVESDERTRRWPLNWNSWLTGFVSTAVLSAAVFMVAPRFNSSETRLA